MTKAQEILAALKDAGATTSDEQKAALQDGELLAKLGITDQEAVEEAYALVKAGEVEEHDTGIYSTYYRTEVGQPQNGVETHEDFRAALAAWRANIKALPQRGGGESVIEAIGGAPMAESLMLCWVESAEGGYAHGQLLADDGRVDSDNERNADAIVEILAR